MSFEEPQSPITPLAYRPGEAAKLINISRSLLYRLMAEGEIPTFMVAGCRLISRRAIEEYISTREQTGQQAA